MLVPMASAANWVQFEIKELDGSSDLSTDYFDADSVMCQVDANGDSRYPHKMTAQNDSVLL